MLVYVCVFVCVRMCESECVCACLCVCEVEVKKTRLKKQFPCNPSERACRYD